MTLYAINYASPDHGIRYLSMTTQRVWSPFWTYDTPRMYMTESGAKAAIKHLPVSVQKDCWVTRMVLKEAEGDQG